MNGERAAAGMEAGSMRTLRFRLPVLAIRWRQLFSAAANRAVDSLAATLGRGATCTGCCAL
jgi:hypothetical protein